VPLKQLKITVERSGTELTVDYNPEEYTVNKDNNFAVQSVPGLASPIVQFVNGNQRTLEVELFFDTYDTPTLPKEDVRDKTRQVVDLMAIDGELHAPPVLSVSMASLNLRCVLSRVSERYLMFMPNGVPVRARVNCTFIEYVDPVQQAKADNLQTADFSGVEAITLGTTVSGIAARVYEDARLWRPIAIANGIANPRRLRAGDTLRIPSLPFVDPTTGEAVS
jgi:Contractile injection system tube protein/LysM domain